MRLCRNDDGNRVHAKGRCRACYVFWSRNGYDRPEELIIRANTLAFERRIFRRRMATGT